MEKTKLALVLLRFCMKAMGYTEKATQKNLTMSEYCIDSKIDKRIRLYFKTSVITTALILKLKEEVELIGSAGSTSETFGTMTIGVSYILKAKPLIEKKFGPLDDVKKNDEKVTPQGDKQQLPTPIFADLKNTLKEAGYKVKNNTRYKGAWILYFDDATAASSAWKIVEPFFPKDLGEKLSYTTGETVIKIHESLVITRGRKLVALDATAKVATTRKKRKATGSGLEEFTAELLEAVTKVAVKFIVEKTGTTEEEFQKKLERRFHLIDKTVAQVKIPMTSLSGPMEKGNVVIPMSVIMKQLKKK